MQALELWLVRHGETPWNREGRLTGWTDLPLTPLGEAQARALRPFLEAKPFAGVWASDLERAVRTAELAYGPPRRDARLREIHFGQLEGAFWETLEPRYKAALLAFEGFQAPGGESVQDLERRVRGFVAELEPGRHLVFTHGGVVRWFLRAVGADRFVPNAAVVGIDWTRRSLRFVRGEGA